MNRLFDDIKKATTKDPIAEVQAHLETIPEANTKQERFRSKYGAEKERLVRVLVDLPKESTVTYGELRKILDMDPRKYPGRAIVHQACKELLKNYKQVWKIAKKFGLIHQTDEQVIDNSGRDLKSVRKRMRRSGERVLSTDYDKLDAVRKIKHDTHITIASAIQSGLSSRGISAIENRVKDSQKRLENGEAYASWFSEFKSLPPSRK